MMGTIEKDSAEADRHTGDCVCMVYHKELLYSGGADGKIKIWDKDLHLRRTSDAHDAHIYAMVMNSKGRLYTSSCDGTIKYWDNPSRCINGKQILTCTDEIESMYICSDDFLYTGDDKGVVIIWANDRIRCKFNLKEQVKSIAVANKIIFTVRDLDVVVTEYTEGVGKYVTRKVVEGKSPLLLFGPNHDEKIYLAYVTRDGKGFKIVNNDNDAFDVVCAKDNAHDMIINCFCSDGDTLFTGGYDGKIKKWIGVGSETGLEMYSVVDVGACVNFLCLGPDNSLYAALTDGSIKRIRFYEEEVIPEQE